MPPFPRGFSDAPPHHSEVWSNTFASTNPVQYFARGMEDWFDAGREAIPADGAYNEINTRAELLGYGPALAGRGRSVPDGGERKNFRGRWLARALVRTCDVCGLARAFVHVSHAIATAHRIGRGALA